MIINYIQYIYIYTHTYNVYSNCLTGHQALVFSLLPRHKRSTLAPARRAAGPGSGMPFSYDTEMAEEIVWPGNWCWSARSSQSLLHIYICYVYKYNIYNVMYNHVYYIYIGRCVMYSSIVIFAHNVWCVNAHSYWRPPAGQSLIVFSLSISSPSYAKVKLSWAWTIQRKPTDRSLKPPPKKRVPLAQIWFPQGYWPQKKLALRGHSLFFFGGVSRHHSFQGSFRFPCPRMAKRCFMIPIPIDSGSYIAQKSQTDSLSLGDGFGNKNTDGLFNLILMGIYNQYCAFWDR